MIRFKFSRGPCSPRVVAGRAEAMEAMSRSMSPAEAVGDRVSVDPWPPRDLTCTELPTAMGVVVFRNLLYIKGHTGLEVLNLVEGLIGIYNPAKARALGSESYVALLPGVRSGFKVTVYCTLPYPSVAFPAIPTTVMKLSMAAAWLPTMTSTRR